jgi:hypothetical protein
MNPVEAKRGIIAEWLKRPEFERSELHVPIFYGELIAAGSDLLAFHGPVNRYDRIRLWLSPHVSTAISSPESD